MQQPPYQPQWQQPSTQYPPYQQPSSWQQPPQSPQPWQQPYPPQQPYYPPPMMTPPPLAPKKRHTWLWIVLGIIGILLFACIGASVLATRTATTAVTTIATTIASTATAIPQPSNQVSQVGGTLTVNDVAVTLVSVKKLAGDQFIQPKAGNEFIVVHVKIINNSTNEVDYTPFDFHVRSGTGNITDEEAVAPTTYTANNLLNSGKLSAGGNVEGDIIFQVGKSDHKTQLTWQPSIFQNAGDNAWNLGL